MPRPDTGNFNRFLTSMGLVLLVAALVVPYFYFRSTDTLRIPAKELGSLTKTSQDVLTGRQDAIADLESWVLGLSGVFAVLGVGLLVTGGRGLRDAQVSEEEEDELRKSRARAEIRRLSPEQLEDKRDEQAREAVEGPQPEAPPASGAATPPVPPRPQSGPQGKRQRPALERDRRYRERRQAISRIEEALLKKLSESEFKSHTFFGNVMVGITDSKSIEIDGLFDARSKSAHRDVLLEVKLWNDASAGMARINVGSLLATVARYQAVTGRSAVGWLVTVVPRGTSTGRNPNQAEARMTEWITPAGLATVVREDDLDGIAEKFENLVESGITQSK